MSETPIPICYILSFEPILRDACIKTCTISKAQLLFHAKLWRRKYGQRIGDVIATNDPKLQKLIAKIDAIPVVDPPITKDEVRALFSLYLKHRDELPPNVWKHFCSLLKNYNEISFNLGALCLSRCVDSLVPFEQPVPFGALDRLFYDLVPAPALNRFLTIATKQEHDMFWPSVFEFFGAIYDLFEHNPNAVITDDGVRLDGSMSELIQYAPDWDPRLTVVLEKIKNKTKK